MKIAQALTIAGSDSGGGAGIQADLKTFQERGVYGMSVLTAVTAQNTLGVKSFHKVPLVTLDDQLDAIREDLMPQAVKTGMLVDAEIIHHVAQELKDWPGIQLVIDPVMIAKGGEALLEWEALQTLRKELLPLATLVTPNIPEAEALVGMSIETVDDTERAARMLVDLGAGAVVIKGGHANMKQAADFFFSSELATWLTSKRFDTKHTHGTGCTFSACITAELAKGTSLAESVRIGKAFISCAIEQTLGIGHGHGPTNHFAYREREWK
ncbi:bifunctional hydroxymethylpyrimidine kinase/phosphomethylpyrimidine kinase [Listeria aquatica]|uniref:bifunctional hydroxymethylpyrimidine kinase/phosphomethylpyrimidine kinase n=1 Tax=Listeria aquatica TaxID=1494960 RepID=UPI003F70B3DE